MRLFLLLLAVPVIEIALFIEVGGLIGTWPTVAVVILTALVGSILLRRQGVAALQGFQARLAAGETPGHLLADGAMILVAGALLLTPGFFTDAVGFLLLMPPVRAALWRWASSRITIASQGGTSGFHFQARTRGGRGGFSDGTTVDGEYSEVRPEPRSPDGPQLDHDPR
ncbi:MAG: FxsA family protein [Pseudomonadota bacterium]